VKLGKEEREWKWERKNQGHSIRAGKKKKKVWDASPQQSLNQERRQKRRKGKYPWNTVHARKTLRKGKGKKPRLCWP